MTKDQFLNSWSMELSMSCSLSSIESKKFLHAFYDKVIGFEKSLQPEITEEEIERIIEDTPKRYGRVADAPVIAKAILTKLKER